MSQPKVSVILAVKNASRTIDTCIQSVLSQTYKNIEFIIVDNNSNDGTAEIIKKYSQIVYFNQGPERSAQRNFGLQHAKGIYTFFIDADMYLNEGLINQAVEILETQDNIKSLYIPEETIATGFWGKCKKFERDFYISGDESAEAVRFFYTEYLRNIGGYQEELVGSEDWDLSDRYTAIYSGTSRTTLTIVHDEGHITLSGLLKKKKYYSQTGTTSYLHNPNVPSYRKVPFPFRPSVKKQWYKFLRHPILGVGTIVLKLLEGLNVTGWHKLIFKNK